jgi:hypothetical protein
MAGLAASSFRIDLQGKGPVFDFGSSLNSDDPFYAGLNETGSTKSNSATNMLARRHE